MPPWQDRIDLAAARLRTAGAGLYSCPPALPGQKALHCCLAVLEEAHALQQARAPQVQPGSTLRTVKMFANGDFVSIRASSRCILDAFGIHADAVRHACLSWHTNVGNLERCY